MGELRLERACEVAHQIDDMAAERQRRSEFAGESPWHALQQRVEPDAEMAG